MKKHVNVVGAIFLQDGKIFAARRTKGKPYVVGKYEFVGGKIENGESEQEALKRELFEEMNLPVEVLEHFVTVDFAYPDFDVTLSTYFCKMTSDYVLKEHSEALFLPLNEVKEEEWAPADKEILLALKAAKLPV